MNVWKWIGIISLSVAVGITHAQQTFQQKLDSTAMLIGDQQYLTLMSPQDQVGEKPFIILDTLHWFQVLDKGSWVFNKTVYERKILFTVFDSGYFRIPMLYGTGIPDSTGYPGNALYLYVNNPSDSLAILRPIKEIEETHNTRRLIYAIVLACLLILGMLFVIWQFFKADRTKPASMVIIPDKKIWEKSMEALYELEEKKLWQQNQTKAYYDELNYILRGFISHGLKLPALELTSKEIMESLEESGIELKDSELLKSCFTQSDFVKFANAVPSYQDNEQWMEFAKAFVRNNQELSEKILEEKRIHWMALLGAEQAEQFEFPLDTVPELFVQTYQPMSHSKLELIDNFIRRKTFYLPDNWVKLHQQESGLFNRWHHGLLNISTNKFLQVFLLLFALPFISIFLPFLILMGLWKKEAIFSRGLFGLSNQSKLVIIKELK